MEKRLRNSRQGLYSIAPVDLETAQKTGVRGRVRERVRLGLVDVHDGN